MQNSCNHTQKENCTASFNAYCETSHIQVLISKDHLLQHIIFHLKSGIYQWSRWPAQDPHPTGATQGEVTGKARMSACPLIAYKLKQGAVIEWAMAGDCRISYWQRSNGPGLGIYVFHLCNSPTLLLHSYWGFKPEQCISPTASSSLSSILLYLGNSGAQNCPHNKRDPAGRESGLQQTRTLSV